MSGRVVIEANPWTHNNVLSFADFSHWFRPFVHSRRRCCCCCSCCCGGRALPFTSPQSTHITKATVCHIPFSFMCVFFREKTVLMSDSWESIIEFLVLVANSASISRGQHAALALKRYNHILFPCNWATNRPKIASPVFCTNTSGNNSRAMCHKYTNNQMHFLFTPIRGGY